MAKTEKPNKKIVDSIESIMKKKPKDTEEKIETKPNMKKEKVLSSWGKPNKK